jgi:predicted transcriptional regulator
MKEIISLLKTFNFSELEAEVYLNTLKLGKPTVTELARKMGMGRTAVYFHIKNLVSKKALLEIKVGKKFRYTATAPEELLKNMESNVSSFKDYLPELDKLSRIEKEVPQIEVRESMEAYLQFYDELSHLPRNSEIRILEGRGAVLNEINSLTGDRWNKFFTSIADRKIVTRAIFTDTGLKEAQKFISSNPNSPMKERLFHMKVLSESLMPFTELLCIYGNKVIFIFPESAMVVFIKHQRISQAMKAVFDSLHYFAEPVVNPWNK